MATVAANQDVNDWDRRESKRRDAVQMVKASPAYAACRDRPGTPAPSNRAVTKRQWEWSMREWRQALRPRATQNPMDWLGGPEEPQVAYTTNNGTNADSMVVSHAHQLLRT